VAGLIGVIGIGAALAVGQFVAAFVGAGASPFLAVGDAAVDRTPGWLKEFAVDNFGTDDKLVLLSSMGVVLVLFGVLAGLASRRNALPGTVFAIVLGVVGVGAVLARDDLGQLGVLAPVVSLVAGVLAFRTLHRVALDWITARDAEAQAREQHDADGDADDGGHGGRGLFDDFRDDDPHDGGGSPATLYGDNAGDSRRRFLMATGGVVVGAGVAGLAGELIAANNNVEASREAVGLLKPVAPATVPVGADFAASGTPAFITDADSFYRVDTALTVPQVSTQDWSLKIHGMVDKEMTLSFADIRERKLVEQVITLTCVSNPVGGPYISNAKFIGVLLRDLLTEAGVRKGADQLLSTSVDGYTAGTPVDALLDDRGAMLAIGMNGQPLPVEHGFPARMVVPGLYGYVSATKWVTDMELTTFSAKQGYWVPRGYSQQAPIKTESRIDVPASFARVTAGNVTLAGIAWAQTKGIAKVEVRIDGGPWQEAQLSTQVNKNTWRMWRANVDLRSGQHTVESRATDQTGYTQTDSRSDAIPDGASGWPSVVFTVA
jgi:DMSO/TMAO reductase YedYZ molybdopterin-dependent catalytic subunit